MSLTIDKNVVRILFEQGRVFAIRNNNNSNLPIYLYAFVSITFSVLLILYTTLFSRDSISLARKVELTPFWSYIQWWNGNKKLGLQIIENILLFIPLGYSLSAVLKKRSHCFLICLLLSIVVEILQYYLRVGLCELDDILDNTLGGVLGFILYEKLKVDIKIKMGFLTGMIIAGSIIFISIKPSEGTVLERQFAFHAEVINHTIEGYCFVYEDPFTDYELLLKSEEDEILVSTSTLIARPDVEKYFHCDKDYSHTGFMAKGEWDPGETYEVFIKLRDGTKVSTGYYIQGTNVVHTKESAPLFHGTLLVSKPDFGFFVYQDGRDLYWLADKNAFFEDDGSTYIQYQLWTTQTDRLPTHRLENDWDWDNISFKFEEYEIEQFEDYRVAKASLPEDYSITTIVTGYFTNDEWVWKEYFRPILKGVFF